MPPPLSRRRWFQLKIELIENRTIVEYESSRKLESIDNYQSAGTFVEEYGSLINRTESRSKRDGWVERTLIHYDEIEYANELT